MLILQIVLFLASLRIIPCFKGDMAVCEPIPVQSMEEILADKMVAFAFRERRIKPRDIWDIIWLKQRGINQNPELILKKLDVRGKQIKEYVANTTRHAELVKSDQDTKLDFEAEMGRFLPQDIRSSTIANEQFWPYVGQEIIENVTHINNTLTGNSPAKNRTFKM